MFCTVPTPKFQAEDKYSETGYLDKHPIYIYTAIFFTLILRIRVPKLVCIYVCSRRQIRRDIHRYYLYEESSNTSSNPLFDQYYVTNIQNTSCTSDVYLDLFKKQITSKMGLFNYTHKEAIQSTHQDPNDGH